MNNEWWRQLKGRPFYWVLDGTDPVACYYMLKYVVERPDSARALKAARLDLMESPQVAAVKARLGHNSAAVWDEAYQSSLWALRLLAEWEHPGDDETIAECLDGALDNYQAGASPFALPLLLHCATALGFYGDARVQMLLSRAESHLRKGQNSRWLALLAMALAPLPPEQRSQSLLQALQTHLALIEPSPVFSTYAFPTYDTPDDLTIAEAALRLGIGSEWITPWIERIVAAQDEEGLWRTHTIHPLRDDVTAVPPHSPNRWISAKALYVLRTYFGE